MARVPKREGSAKAQTAARSGMETSRAGDDVPDLRASAPSPEFATTHWSVILTAKDSEQALQQLCQTYWYPLYAYIRRRGYSCQDAEDLTQGLLCQLLARNSFARIDRAKGRFRSFLLAAANYYLADAQDRACALKRGGRQVLQPLELAEAEQRYAREAEDALSPDKLFDRRWAVTLVEEALARMELEYRACGKEQQFRRLSPFLAAGSCPQPYASLAVELGISREAIKKAVQRMRQRYAQLFREEIARTVTESSKVDEEIRDLCAVLTER